MQKLEELLQETQITDRQHKQMRDLDDFFINFGRRTGKQTTSIGSSSRGTYIPNEYGLAGDTDLYILDPKDEDMPQLIRRIELSKFWIESTLSKIYGKPIEFKMYKAVDSIPEPKQGIAVQPEKEDYKQLMYVAIDKQGNELFKVDFNYTKAFDGSEQYNNYFERRLDAITAKLGEQDRKAGKDYIVQNIRAFKLLLDKNDVYKANKGGLGGIASEVAMLDLFDEQGSPETMEELRASYSVGNILEKINREGEGLRIYHPTKASRDDFTEKKTPQQRAYLFRKLTDIAKHYKDYLPAARVYGQTAPLQYAA